MHHLAEMLIATAIIESKDQSQDFRFPPDFRPPGVNISAAPPAFRAGRLAYVSGAIGFIVGLISLGAIAGDEAAIFGGTVTGVLCYIVGVIYKYARGIDYSAMGIVTYLHAAGTPSNHFSFYLQITDNDWTLLKDQNEISVPAVKVSTSAGNVHGPALMEGSKVILKGRFFGNRKPVEAREIWNFVQESYDTSTFPSEIVRSAKETATGKEEEQVKKSHDSASIFSLERTIWEPVHRDFILSSPRALTNVKNWIEKNNPSMYWFILCINNNSEQSIDEWGVELQTQATLKLLEARIEGSEEVFNVNKSYSKPWLTHWVLGIPHTLGIVIPKKGSKRIYFKLSSDACGVEYYIGGKVTTSDYETPIEKKYFNYSCDVANLKVVVRTNPKDAEKYAEAVLLDTYSKDTALKLLNSFRIIQEIEQCCSLEKHEKIQDKLQLLLGALESANVGDTLIHMVKDNLESVSILNETDASVHRTDRLCGNLVDVWINEVLRT